MAKQKKFDYVVEAVHYAPDGSLLWVRAYERRGPTFSDHKVLTRTAFMDLLRSGKKAVFGERVEFEASTFKVSDEITLTGQANAERLVLAGNTSGGRELQGVPVL
ncbi:MAG: hypothetical protein OHK0052_05940 [Anaerolineales bacterium]